MPGTSWVALSSCVECSHAVSVAAAATPPVCLPLSHVRAQARPRPGSTNTWAPPPRVACRCFQQAVRPPQRTTTCTSSAHPPWHRLGATSPWPPRCCVGARLAKLSRVRPVVAVSGECGEIARGAGEARGRPITARALRSAAHRPSTLVSDICPATVEDCFTSITTFRLAWDVQAQTPVKLFGKDGGALPCPLSGCSAARCCAAREGVPDVPTTATQGFCDYRKGSGVASNDDSSFTAVPKAGSQTCNEFCASYGLACLTSWTADVDVASPRSCSVQGPR